MGKNFYEILGLKKTATEADIKLAYRELAKKYHPDVYSGDDQDKFASINLSYQFLLDLVK